MSNCIDVAVTIPYPYKTPFNLFNEKYVFFVDRRYNCAIDVRYNYIKYLNESYSCLILVLIALSQCYLTWQDLFCIGPT